MRRQTAARAGEREVQVLDYQNTAADLLPLVAACYALIFMVRLARGAISVGDPVRSATALRAQ